MKVKGRKKSKNIQDRRKAPLVNDKWSLETSINRYIDIRSKEYRAKKAGGSLGKRPKSTGKRTGGGF